MIIMETKKLMLSFAMFVLFGSIGIMTYGCTNMPLDRATGNFVKEDRPVSNFTALEIGGAFKVYLIQGSQEKLTIEADEDEIGKIVTEVQGNTLKIYTEQWASRFHEMTIWLTFKDLNNLDFSGAVEVTSEGILNFNELDLDVSGAAEIQLAIKAVNFDAEFSGASAVDLSGQCGKGEIEISGASDFDAQNLEFQDLSVEVSGASSAKVWATGTLDIDASGASDIRYKGSPKVTVNESGASTVKPM